ncbi:glutamate receptor ionotropic, kainate glr-3-like [Macrobrachium nipponense]|uniref:glutamate receptor ionotropic, kainate glr-3-like n=1 Tax=Macrobrachium nipponense TaxID=159736 RepID=UPI0030C871E9
MITCECLQGTKDNKGYPCLTEFLLDYLQHYSYTEIHIVVYQQDQKILEKAFLSLLRSGITATVVMLRPSGVIPVASSGDGTEGSTMLPKNFAFLTSGEMPVFLTTFGTISSLQDAFDWSFSRASREATWVFIGQDMKSFLSKDSYFPLDNKIIFAQWNNQNNSRTAKIDLWEAYQAAPHLTKIATKVGYWGSPLRHNSNPSSSSFGSPPAFKLTTLDRGANSTNVPEEKKKETGADYFFPSGNIEPRRNDLTGLHIRCLTDTWEPFTDNQPDAEYGVKIGGFMGQSFDVIRDLLNFTYTCRQAPDRQFGDKINGSWTGLVGELLNGRGDVIVTALDSTYERTQVIDFCLPSGVIEYGLIIRRPEPETWTNYTRIMDLSAWLVYLCYIVISCLLYHIFVVWADHGQTQPLADSVFDIMSLHVNQGDIAVEGASKRIFLFVVVMTSWLTLTFYTSVLISSLTIPLINPPFKDIAGLLKVKSYDMGLQKGNSEVERFRTSKDPAIQEAWSKIVMQNPANLVQTAEEGIRRVMEESFAFFLESGYYFYHNSNNCSIIPVGGTVFRYGAGIAVQMDSPLRLILNYQ